jgi:hypothetical protein
MPFLLRSQSGGTLKSASMPGIFRAIGDELRAIYKPTGQSSAASVGVAIATFALVRSIIAAAATNQNLPQKLRDPRKLPAEIRRRVEDSRDRTLHPWSTVRSCARSPCCLGCRSRWIDVSPTRHCFMRYQRNAKKAATSRLTASPGASASSGRRLDHQKHVRDRSRFFPITRDLLPCAC